MHRRRKRMGPYVVRSDCSLLNGLMEISPINPQRSDLVCWISFPLPIASQRLVITLVNCPLGGEGKEERCSSLPPFGDVCMYGVVFCSMFDRRQLTSRTGDCTDQGPHLVPITVAYHGTERRVPKAHENVIANREKYKVETIYFVHAAQFAEARSGYSVLGGCIEEIAYTFVIGSLTAFLTT